MPEPIRLGAVERATHIRPRQS